MRSRNHMQFRLLMCLMAIIFGLAGCALSSDRNSKNFSEDASAKESDSDVVSEWMCIKSADLEKAHERAFSGGLASVKKLYWHYLACDSNAEMAFYWGMLAADQCDLEMQDEMTNWIKSYRRKLDPSVLEGFLEKWASLCAAK